MVNVIVIVTGSEACRPCYKFKHNHAFPTVKFVAKRIVTGGTLTEMLTVSVTVTVTVSSSFVTYTTVKE